MGDGRVRARWQRERIIKAQAYLIAGTFTLAAFAAALWAYPRLPEIIPTHWNLSGEIDGHGPRTLILLMGPGVMLLQIALFALLPRIAPKNFAIAPFMETWLDIMVIMVGMTGYFFAMILAVGLQANPAPERALFGGVALLFALIGNLMGKVQRNFFLGFRTPWTLASATVWNDTHRVAARCMVASGAASLVLVVAGASLRWVSLLLVASLLVPIIHSFVRFRTSAHGGEG